MGRGASGGWRPSPGEIYLLIPSFSFGVELEVYLPWCLEGRQPPEAPPMFKNRTSGGPIILTKKEYDREYYQYACERKLKSQLLDYIAKGRETTVVPPIEVDFDGDEAWRHLCDYREWDVKSDSSLTTTNAEFQESGWVTSDLNPPNLEDGSPAMVIDLKTFGRNTFKARVGDSF
ncbi:hypothetical protein F4778DRAFT_283462 [Xylariomycetidae sp. FL2044]|nr:hypothetical protein F4778DRAFT_283462 [Xylariomycetidae sp. FL2044]